MSGCCTVLVAVVSVAASLVPAFAQPAPEVIVDVRVHGNHTTPDEEVLKLAGLSVGAPATDQRIDDAAQALRSSGRFESVDIRKRFASIDDPSQIVLIVVVDERPGVSEDDLVPGPMKRLRASAMWLPILRYEDGYGLTYGARMSFVGKAGSNSRISIPLSWGGERRAAAEIERTFERGPLTRLAAAAGIDRRENPFYDEPQTRRSAEARAERRFAGWLRAGAHVGFSRVTFGGQEDDDEIVAGANLTVDTRVDPAFPRNAVHAVASVEHLHFEHLAAANRFAADARGYRGLIGATVVALRVSASFADGSLPPYEKALLGGASSVRGIPVGADAGDNLASMSAEIRVPFTSPLRLARFGARVFIDAGTVWDEGERLRDQHFEQGIGAGLFMNATVLGLGLDIAWPRSGGPRVHFGLGVTF